MFLLDGRSPHSHHDGEPELEFELDGVVDCHHRLDIQHGIPIRQLRRHGVLYDKGLVQCGHFANRLSGVPLH